MDQRFIDLEGWFVTLPEGLRATSDARPTLQNQVTPVLTHLATYPRSVQHDVALVQPLIEAWDCVSRAARHILSECRAKGWFDYPTPGQQRPTRPDFTEEFFEPIITLFKTHHRYHERVRHLVEARICRDPRIAQQCLHSLPMNLTKDALQRCWDTKLVIVPNSMTRDQVHLALRALFQQTRHHSQSCTSLVQAGVCQDLMAAQQMMTILAPKLTKAMVYRCWKQGLFDRFVDHPSHWARPTQQQIENDVLPLINQTPWRNKRSAVLKQQRRCRTESNADNVAWALTAIEERSLGIVRSVLLAVAAYGAVGLLRWSASPYADELQQIERWRSVIQLDRPTLHAVREILVWLYDHIHGSTSAPQQCQLQWWKILVLLPANHVDRCAIYDMARTALQHHVLSPLGDEHPVGTMQAVIDAFLRHGVAGIVDAYGQQPLGTLRHTIRQRHITTLLDHHLRTMTPPYQHIVRTLFAALQETLDATGYQMPLVMLLSAPPRSPCRYRYSRRLPWSPRNQRPRRARLARTPQHSIPDTVLHDVAGRTNLTIGQVKQRLLGLVLYGVGGLLTATQRNQAHDQRLITIIQLWRLGHTDGVIAWDELTRVVTHDATTRGLVPLPQQRVKQVFLSYPKRRRWNGGEGPQMVQVRQRASLAIKRPLLHDHWTLQPVSLTLQAGRTTRTYDVLVMIELATSAPIGLWVCGNESRADAVRLALYDGIWHPWAIQYPLRGIPRHLHIPNDLLPSPDDVLYRAATYLGTTIHPCVPEKRKRHPVIDAIKHAFPHWVLEKTVTIHYTAWELHASLLQWIPSVFFRFHQSVPVPPAIAQHGVALPGHDTPAAGWLLPQSTPVQTIRDGVTDGVGVYRHPLVKLSPGITLSQRRYPWLVAHREYGMFIESTSKQEPLLEYLVLSTR